MAEGEWRIFLRWRLCSFFGWTPKEADEVIADRDLMIQYFAYIEAHAKAGFSMIGERIR